MNARKKAKFYKRLLDQKPLQLVEKVVKESYYDPVTLTCEKCLTVNNLYALGNNAINVIKNEMLIELIKNLDDYIVYETEKTFDGEITVRATIRVLKPIKE